MYITGQCLTVEKWSSIIYSWGWDRASCSCSLSLPLVQSGERDLKERRRTEWLHLTHSRDTATVHQGPLPYHPAADTGQVTSCDIMWHHVKSCDIMWSLVKRGFCCYFPPRQLQCPFKTYGVSWLRTCYWSLSPRWSSLIGQSVAATVVVLQWQLCMYWLPD